MSRQGTLQLQATILIIGFQERGPRHIYSRRVHNANRGSSPPRFQQSNARNILIMTANAPKPCAVQNMNCTCVCQASLGSLQDTIECYKYQFAAALIVPGIVTIQSHWDCSLLKAQRNIFPVFACPGGNMLPILLQLRC